MDCRTEQREKLSGVFGKNGRERLFCLDLLRGLDMFYLTCLGPVLGGLCCCAGKGSWQQFLLVHNWGGFTLYDIIMPLFIFMCGAAVPFAMRSRLDGDGRPTAAFHRHVWARFAMLWILGMMVQGDLCTLDIHRISPYSNTLQTIAVGYVAAAYVMLLRRRSVRIAIPVVLAAVYGLIVHFGGDYTKEGNATVPVELAILNSFMPADNLGTKHIIEWGYTWFLPSLMFPVITLAGAFSSQILRSDSLSRWRRAGALALYGAGSLLTGFVLERAGVACVKQIFTVSFTFQAIGWSILALDSLYVLTDILRFRKGMGLLLLFGQCSLAAYVLKWLLGPGLRPVIERVFAFVTYIPADCPNARHLVYTVLSAVLLSAVLLIWKVYRTARAETGRRD